MSLFLTNDNQFRTHYGTTDDLGSINFDIT